MTRPTEQPAFFIVREMLDHGGHRQIINGETSFRTIEAAAVAFDRVDHPHDVIRVDLAWGMADDVTKEAITHLAFRSWNVRRPLSETIAALADHFDVQHWREPTEHWAASYQRARGQVEARS